ncbi:MAG: exosortase C-terminal domain/associated protein EpsI [Bryobacteraceae bacterium]
MARNGGGERQPHSPRICLPANGWNTLSSGEVAIGTSAGPVTANRYLAASRNSRAAILYWYQLPRRTVASEWLATIPISE